MVYQMAYVNVADWSHEHVAEWLRGLEYSLLPYVQFFLNNEIDGSRLLNLTANDLEDLHIFKIGHQQLILEAVELLRQLHYSLNSETLQSLVVKLSCKARSLYNDLKMNGPCDHVLSIRQERISTNVLSSVSEVLTSVKGVVAWLDEPPFEQDSTCLNFKKSVLKLSIELALTTQRDQFAERPHLLIKKNSAHLAELCDQFVQKSMDSLILQPASLDIALIRKKPDEELGIHIKSTYSGVHVIGGIKDQSPAKSCNKVEKGDEIVQVNYQTVIGWQQKKLVTTMTEHSTELHLTLKKGPRHVNLLGEVIILRPYRIPSKKKTKKCNWLEETKQSGSEINSKFEDSRCFREEFGENDDSAFLPSSDSLLLTSELSLQHIRHQGNGIVSIQRRATVSGASPTLLLSPCKYEDLITSVNSAKSLTCFDQNISSDFASKRTNLENQNRSENKQFKKKSDEVTSENSSIMGKDESTLSFLNIFNSSLSDKNFHENFHNKKQKYILLADSQPIQNDNISLEDSCLEDEKNYVETEGISLFEKISEDEDLFYSETDGSESYSPIAVKQKGENCSSEINLFSYENLISFQKKARVSNPSSYKNALNSNALLHKEKAHIKFSSLKVPPDESKRLISSILPHAENLDLSSNHNITDNSSLNSIESDINLRNYSESLSKQDAFENKLKNIANHKNGNNQNFTHLNPEHKEYNSATSSLGRSQKQFVKEITPGFVARMAVSYTNLSKNDSSFALKSDKKYNLCRSIQSPGYVAKISDSFDQLAIQNKHIVQNYEKLCFKQFSDVDKEKDLEDPYKSVKHLSDNCATKTNKDIKKQSRLISVEACVMKPNNYQNSNFYQPKKYTSLLDKEYNKLFEGRKVSQCHINSSNQNKYLGSCQEEKSLFSNIESKNMYSVSDSNSLKKNQNKRNKLQTLAKRHEEIFIKSISLPYNRNISNNVCSSFSSPSQFGEAFSSHEMIKNTRLNFNNPINTERSNLKLLQFHKSDSILKSSTTSYMFADHLKNSSLEVTTTDIDSPKMSFKFFSSPNFMRKLTSPKLDKKNAFKSKKLSKELKRGEQKKTTLHQNERKFFGSPILGKKFFVSPKKEKENLTVSSVVQTDMTLLSSIASESCGTHTDVNSNKQSIVIELPKNVISSINCCQNVVLKSDCNFSLNYSQPQTASNSLYYTETNITPEIAKSLPHVSDRIIEEEKSAFSDISRILSKPMMGIKMLNKKRLPSISGESCISVSSSKCSQQDSSNWVLSEVARKVNGKENDQELKKLIDANITVCTTVPNLEEIDNPEGSWCKEKA